MLPPVLIVLLVMATLCAVVSVIYACLYYTRINPSAAARRRLRHGCAGACGKTRLVTVTSSAGATTTTNPAGVDDEQTQVFTSQLPITATHLFLFRKTNVAALNSGT